jgi:hypothetical protein
MRRSRLLDAAEQVAGVKPAKQRRSKRKQGK